MLAEFALQQDQQNIGRRYVEVFRCKKLDYYHATAAEVHYDRSYDDYHGTPVPSCAMRSLNKDKLEYTEVLRLRGLPYFVKKSDIVKFFADFNLTNDKAHIGYRYDGKATEEAYVEFVSAGEAKKAISRDNRLIGTQYIELFPSTPDEARRAQSRSRQ